MTGIIILAAGSSGRLGSPKQNLIYKGETLLQRAVRAAKASACNVIIVVLGANEEIIKPTIEGLNITTIRNPDWQEGMASSIRTGVNNLRQSGQNIDSAILMLCDQPFIDAELLNQLVQRKQAKGITACTYKDTIGPPVLFTKKYFDELLLLKGHEGAKKLILKYPGDVETIPFPLGAVDIDTMEDFERL
jgi:molybdenum cofactor cytidylyltransferase